MKRDVFLAKSAVPGTWFTVLTVPVEFENDLPCWDGIWVRIEDPPPEESLPVEYVPAANIMSGKIKAIPSGAEVERVHKIVQCGDGGGVSIGIGGKPN